MTPSLDGVLADDALLDRLGRRSATGEDVADPAVALLAALAADVDVDLPATELPAGSVAAVLSMAPPPARGLSRRVVRVGRGGAVAAAVAMVLGSAGVAAAVSGDPVGAFGLRTIAKVVTHHQDKPSRDQVDRLTKRIDAAAAERGVDPARVAALRSEAAALPDGGGPEVRQHLAALEAALAAGTASGLPGVAPVGTPSAPAGPGVATGAPTGGPGGTPAGPGETHGPGTPSSTDDDDQGDHPSATKGPKKPKPSKPAKGTTTTAGPGAVQAPPPPPATTTTPPAPTTSDPGDGDGDSQGQGKGKGKGKGRTALLG
ncbi:hypothetical protein GCM10027446_08040 [Angustibacter peucedani]